MIDNYNLMMQSRAKQVTTNQTCQQTSNTKIVPNTDSKGITSSSPVEHLNRPSTPCLPLGENQDAKLAGNTTDNKGEETAQTEHMDSSNKENSSPNCPADPKCSKGVDSSSQSTQKSDSKDDTQTARGQSCLRCVKRRHTEASSDNTHSSDCNNGPKRTKVECKNDKSDSVSSGPEPMQTESPQISNLVACFNTGFTGLLSHVGSSTSDSATSASSDSHISSCATQLKSGFPSISAPVLALSV